MICKNAYNFDRNKLKMVASKTLLESLNQLLQLLVYPFIHFNKRQTKIILADIHNIQSCLDTAGVSISEEGVDDLKQLVMDLSRFVNIPIHSQFNHFRIFRRKFSIPR